MKYCPKCNRAYYDNSLNYCLEDGSFLKVYDPEATILSPTKVSNEPETLVLEEKSAPLVELKEQKIEPVKSFGESHGLQIALPIALAIGKYADKLTGIDYTKILFILSLEGLVLATYFEKDADLRSYRNAESFIFFDPYEPREAFYLEWKNVSKSVMERILNIEIKIENSPESYKFRH